MSTDTESPFVAHTVSRAVQVSGVSRSKLYVFMQAGELPYSQVGRRRLIADADLRQLIENHRVDGRRDA